MARKSVKPPAKVSKEACRGLELRKKHKRGGTSVGVARAVQLCKRRPVSGKTLSRMKAYFDRHEVDKKGKDWANRTRPSNGKIAWLLWGGNAGRAWAKRMLKKRKKDA